jgi:hypothetical protein
MSVVEEQVKPNPAQWEIFQPRQLLEAFRHIENGGVAVHISGFQFKGHDTAHLLARDEPTLRRAAAILGLDPKWIQRSGGGRSRVHFDIFGAPLRKAISFCPQSESTPLIGLEHKDPS